MRIRTIIAGVLAAALLPAMAAAQTAPSPHQTELARRVIDDVGGQRMLEQLSNTMMGAMMGPMLQGQPADMQAKTRAIIVPAFQATMLRVGPKMMDIIVASYAQTFSEQELTDIDAFYRSPSGQAMVAKMPQMTTALVQQMAPLQVDIRQDFADEVCKRTACNAAMRAAMLGQAPPAH